MSDRLSREFYRQDVLTVAPALLGKYLWRTYPDGTTARYLITETEAYRGGDDLACHASRGRTPRTEVMFGDGGFVYMYLIYGIHWMLNVVSGPVEVPQAVLIRGLRLLPDPGNDPLGIQISGKGNADGPGKLTSLIKVDREFYGEDLVSSTRIWIGESGLSPEYSTGPRVGIDYAGDPWKDMPWRFCISPKSH